MLHGCADALQHGSSSYRTSTDRCSHGHNDLKLNHMRSLGHLDSSTFLSVWMRKSYMEDVQIFLRTTARLKPSHRKFKCGGGKDREFRQHRSLLPSVQSHRVRGCRRYVSVSFIF